MNHHSEAKRRRSHTLTVMGVDIGQKRDPTAIAVAEIDYRESDLPRRRKESHYLVRHLERLQLGTPYPKVSRRIGEICQRVNAQTANRPHVFVDATGVGQPIVDLLKDSAPEAQRIWAVYFTHGDLRTENRGENKITLGKAFLVSRLQMLLQCQRLHLPRGHQEADALVKELLDYEIRVDENANDRYGAFRVGTHDDLVTALGLAVNKEPRISVYPGSESYGI
jgi:hypothetical protein